MMFSCKVLNVIPLNVSMISQESRIRLEMINFNKSELLFYLYIIGIN